MADEAPYVVGPLRYLAAVGWGNAAQIVAIEAEINFGYNYVAGLDLMDFNMYLTVSDLGISHQNFLATAQGTVVPPPDVPPALFRAAQPYWCYAPASFHYEGQHPTLDDVLQDRKTKVGIVFLNIGKYKRDHPDQTTMAYSIDVDGIPFLELSTWRFNTRVSSWKSNPDDPPETKFPKPGQYPRNADSFSGFDFNDVWTQALSYDAIPNTAVDKEEAGIPDIGSYTPDTPTLIEGSIDLETLPITQTQTPPPP